MILGTTIGYDNIVFNSHRIYGPLQLSHLFANWHQIHSNIDTDKDFIFAKDWSYSAELQRAIVVQKKDNNISVSAIDGGMQING